MTAPVAALSRVGGRAGPRRAAPAAGPGPCQTQSSRLPVPVDSEPAALAPRPRLRRRPRTRRATESASLVKLQLELSWCRRQAAGPRVLARRACSESARVCPVAVGRRRLATPGLSAGASTKAAGHARRLAAGADSVTRTLDSRPAGAAGASGSREPEPPRRRILASVTVTMVVHARPGPGAHWHWQAHHDDPSRTAFQCQ